MNSMPQYQSAHEIFEVPSFTYSKVMTASPEFKIWVYDPDHAH